MTTDMTKTQVIRTVIEAAGAAPIVFTTGYASRIAYGIANRPNHFYMAGSMGLAAPIATGLAVASGRPAVAVDGDGALLMNPASMVTAGSLTDVRLIHVVIDDGSYDSTGGQRTGSENIDVCEWARSSGYRAADAVESLVALRALLVEQLASCNAPAFLHCKVVLPGEPVPGRIGTNLTDYSSRFAAWQHTISDPS